MAKPFSLYEPIEHDSDTSTGTADVKTLTPPAGATGFILVFETNGARVSLDGTAPSASNGVPFPALGSPFSGPFRPVAIKWVSMAAGNSVGHVLWLR